MRATLITFEDGTKIVVLIDMEKARETLEVDGFTAGRSATLVAS